MTSLSAEFDGIGERVAKIQSAVTEEVRGQLEATRAERDGRRQSMRTEVESLKELSGRLNGQNVELKTALDAETARCAELHRSNSVTKQTTALLCGINI